MRARNTTPLANLLSAAYLIFVLCVIIFIGYGGFRMYRWLHWKYGYEDRVKQTVEEMVKPECLK
jgi:hypothetical protein